MKKQFLVLLAMALTLIMVLGGCGHGPIPNFPHAESDPEPTFDDYADDPSPDIEPSTNEELPPETEAPVTEEPTEAPPEEENLSGLMILTCIPKGYKYVNGSITYILQCFNMDTGKVTDVAQFDVNPDATVEYPILDQHNFYVNSQDLFSKDYDKLAITARFTSDHSKHAAAIVGPFTGIRSGGAAAGAGNTMMCGIATTATMARISARPRLSAAMKSRPVL